MSVYYCCSRTTGITLSTFPSLKPDPEANKVTRSHYWYNAINISFLCHPESQRKAVDIHEIAVDMAEFFHNTWVKMVEDHLDMSHPKENESHFQKELVSFLTSYAGQEFSLLKNSE